MPFFPSLSPPACALRGRECLFALMVAFSAAFAPLQTSTADTMTLSAVDRGWYRSNGYHGPANTNYAVGDPTDEAAEYRNFFVFDLASVTQPISAASLRLWNPSGGYASTGSDSPGFERYTLFDITTNVTALTSGSGGMSAFQDIGGGVSLGGYAATSADNGAYMTVPLNAAGVAALNAANGPFAVGGAITTLNGDWTDGEMLFGYTGWSSDVTELILTVPEPSTCMLGAGGLACGALVFLTRRRRPRLRLRWTGVWASFVILTASTASAGVVINISEATGGTRFQISGTVTITSSGSSQQWNGFWLNGSLSGRPFISGSNATITHPVIAGSGAISTTVDGSSAITSTQVFSNSYAFAFNTAYRTYAQGNTFTVSGDFTTSQPFNLFVAGNYSANRMGIPYAAPFITNELIAVNVVPEPSGCVLALVAIVGVGMAGASRFRRLQRGASSRSLILAALVLGCLVESNMCHAGPISYQYIRRSLSGYAQASGYTRLVSEVVNNTTGTFVQSISGSSGVPGNYSAFAVSLNSNVPSDGSPVTATANWSSDWTLAPSTFG